MPFDLSGLSRALLPFWAESRWHDWLVKGLFGVSLSPFLVLVQDFSLFWLKVVGMTEQLAFYEIHSP